VKLAYSPRSLCHVGLYICVGEASGAAGVATGALVTAIYASAKGWTIVVPGLAWVGGIGAAL
jgi:putative ABC transport system permease protein